MIDIGLLSVSVQITVLIFILIFGLIQGVFRGIFITKKDSSNLLVLTPFFNKVYMVTW